MYVFYFLKSLIAKVSKQFFYFMKQIGHFEVSNHGGNVENHSYLNKDKFLEIHFFDEQLWKKFFLENVLINQLRAFQFTKTPKSLQNRVTNCKIVNRKSDWKSQRRKRDSVKDLSTG